MLSYLDPGTGSMIAAAFAGGVAGFGVLMQGVRAPHRRRVLEEASGAGGGGTRRAARRQTTTDAARGAAHGVTVRPDAGSFRDPLSRVFVDDDAVWRGLTAEALADFDALAASDVLHRRPRTGRHRRHRTRRRRRRGLPGDVGRRAPSRAHRRAVVSRTSGRSRCSATPPACSWRSPARRSPRS